MAEVTSIRPADLRKIENNLGAIHRDLETLDVRVNQVDSNVQTVYDKVQSLAREFNDYVTVQMRQNRKQVAHTELVRVRQELDKKYGHYDTVRRMTTGILQANDLGVVKKDTISTATEETMISTPGYWLAPCLVALSAWIDDQPDLADRALREGIKRNDEKTSLFFALVCRRVGRRQAALKWTQRYLANQDEENLDRHAVIILDAFASGLLGIDSEGAVASRRTAGQTPSMRSVSRIKAVLIRTWRSTAIPGPCSKMFLRGLSYTRLCSITSPIFSNRRCQPIL